MTGSPGRVEQQPAAFDRDRVPGVAPIEFEGAFVVLALAYQASDHLTLEPRGARHISVQIGVALADRVTPG